jgi:ADP-ribosyl-[dinitrogen reductase] hydrolase
MELVELSQNLRDVINQAPNKKREDLQNSGWVQHTLESVIWGLMTTNNFENALIKVVNLGNDADTAGTVLGALAGAAYGIKAIPPRWRNVLHGEYPVGTGNIWREQEFVKLVDRFMYPP